MIPPGEKIMQLSGQKNPANSGGKKKPATALDNKISRNLSGHKKNHATSWDNKIMQPHGTKKITEPLGTKLALSMGPIKSKSVHKASNCSKLVRMGLNGFKFVHRSKWIQIGPNFPKKD